MANLFEKEFGLPLPQCCSQGSCCKGASPSKPYHQLLERAAQGDDFARGFFSIMTPYQSHQDAEKIVPGIVERTLRAAEKQVEFKISADVVFYSCRYQTTDNRCGVWEDRPQFCRDYPDTPFVVMAPGCAFETWGAACKEKYNAMTTEVSQLKSLKAELARLKALQGIAAMDADPDNLQTVPWNIKDFPGSPTGVQQLAAGTENLSLLLSMTNLYVTSPLRSFFF